MSVKTDIPQDCDSIWFVGDSKQIKVVVENVDSLDDYEVYFYAFLPRQKDSFVLKKGREEGVETEENIATINISSEESFILQNATNYRVVLESPSGEVSTVAYGSLMLTR